MKTQVENHGQKTHGKTTNHNDNKEQIQTDNKEILRHKSGTAISSPKIIDEEQPNKFSQAYSFFFS